MENKQETIFIKGMQFYKPRDGAPEFIKGNIVIQKAELIEFLKTLSTETVRIDLKKSKEKGTLYLALNTFNPIKKVEKEPNMYGGEAEIPADLIPF